MRSGPGDRSGDGGRRGWSGAGRRRPRRDRNEPNITQWPPADPTPPGWQARNPAPPDPQRPQRNPGNPASSRPWSEADRGRPWQDRERGRPWREDPPDLHAHGLHAPDPRAPRPAAPDPETWRGRDDWRDWTPPDRGDRADRADRGGRGDRADRGDRGGRHPEAWDPDDARRPDPRADRPQPDGRTPDPRSPQPRATDPRATPPLSDPRAYPPQPAPRAQAPRNPGREPDEDDRPLAPPPAKITVTRVAVWRSRQLGQQAVRAFRRAAHADGAKQSGLSSLTYAVMLNYASDATMAVALANTLFFSAATAESKAKVALYLLITVAPFALVAPVIGPALDRIQQGRRIALAVSCVGQALLAVVMALHFDDWLLYPAALGSMVLSKSFTVLKAAVTPRVLPDGITLSKTNARLTVFGLAASAVFGAFGAGFAKLFGSPGALWFTALLCLAGAWLCLRIPSWVEVTEGEVPASLRAAPKARRQPMGRHVVVALWGNGAIRMLTGFLMLFSAFVVRAQTEQEPVMQVLLLGLIAGAAGLGSFLGNAIGARLHFGKPDQVVIGCVVGSLGAVVVAAVMSGVVTAALVGLVGATASGLAKISLDAVIQDDLPEESRASAFGRSETILQLTWVFGGALGVLLPPTYWIGFTVLAVLLALGLAQTVLTRRGGSLLPQLGSVRARLTRRPATAGPPLADPPTAGFPTPDLPTPGFAGPTTGPTPGLPPTRALPTERFASEPPWPAPGADPAERTP